MTPPPSAWKKFCFQALVSKVWDKFVVCIVQVRYSAYQIMRNCMEVD